MTTKQKTPDSRFDIPFDAPDGFVWAPTLLATIETAARFARVSPRTIRNWLAERGDVPLPAVYREGHPPLIYILSMLMWIALKRRRDPDFGKHGGLR
jgi:hypothetical protein